MTREPVLEMLDRLRELLSERRRLTRVELEDLTDDTPLLERSLTFLRDRDEIMIMADDHVFCRATLTTEIVRLVRRDGPLSPRDITRELELPNAVVFELVGWLEREGRLLTRQRDGVLEVRSP